MLAYATADLMGSRTILGIAPAQYARYWIKFHKNIKNNKYLNMA